MTHKYITLGEAIRSINPNATYTIHNDDLDNVEWGNTTPISKENILAKQSELQAIENAKPSIEELRDSAKAKLIAGEKLTEDEANILVGV